MSQTGQTYATHVRWHPPFHFVLSPILFLHLIYTIWKLYQEPGFDRAEQVMLAIGLFILGALVRINPLKAQDRIILLEEKLRYQKILPAELAARAESIPPRFIVALRFASDEELSGLVTQVLDGKFEKPGDVKKAVKNWRGDYFRV